MHLNYLYKLALSMIALLSPIATMVHLVLILVAVDWLTGIYCSRVVKKVPIISSRLRRTIEKFVFYSVAIILGFAFQQVFVGWIPISNFVAGYIAITELISIFENVDKITNLKVSQYLKNFKNSFISKITKKGE